MQKYADLLLSSIQYQTYIIEWKDVAPTFGFMYSIIYCSNYWAWFIYVSKKVVSYNEIYIPKISINYFCVIPNMADTSRKLLTPQ